MPRSKFQPQQQYDATQASWAYGRVQGTCDSTGSLIVTMSLSGAPTTFVVTPVGTTQQFCSTYNHSTSGSTVRFFGTGSGNVGAVGVTASWVAYV